MSTEHEDKSPDGISRRGFLKGVGAGAVATSLLQEVTEHAEVHAQSSAAQGPGEVPVTLNVNGKNVKLNVEPRVTLLDALRNRADITGAKKVCDRATCGACTVTLDGNVVYACSVLALEAQGRKIVTPEGLGTPENMTPIQESFIENDALQCGFCTPGFVMAATDFVKTNPGASYEEVRAGLGGNLCRCGTYAGITEAAYETAKAAAKGGA